MQGGLMKKAVQQIMLGSVTGTEEKARETLRLIREAGYDAIELNSFMITPTPMMVRLLTKAAGMPTGKGGRLDWKSLVEEAGLSVVSVHENLGAIEKDPEAILREAEQYQTKNIVLTGMYRFDYSDETAMADLCRRLNEAGKRLAEGGVSFLYHNHNCEFRKLPSGKTAWQFLQEETDPAYVNFEFDSYWPTEAGVNALDCMKQLGDRMKLYHITDRGTRLTGPSMTPILKSDCMELGSGNMDLPALIEQARQARVEALVLESHKNWIDKSPIASLQKSGEYLHKVDNFLQ